MGSRRVLRVTGGGRIEFYEEVANGSSKIAIKAPDSLAADYTLTLPGIAPAAGQILQSDGSGGLSFASDPTGRPLEYFRHVGATNESWYPVGDPVKNTLSSGNLVLTDNLLYALPWASLRGGVLDRIRYNVDVAGDVASRIRVGLYQATSAVNLYPAGLVTDFGELAGNTTGYRDTTINQTLAAQSLYWFAMLVDVGGGTVPEVLGAILGNAIFGYVSSAVAGTATRGWISVAQAYGALPGTFPAGGTLQSVLAPRILVRFSS
jgi:hypothetical protein